MPADDDLRRRLSMFVGDLDERSFAEQAATSQWAPGFRFDPLLVVKGAQSFLLKFWMKLDLVDRRRDAGFSDDPLDVILVEVRDADRANPSILLQTDQRLPAFDIAVRPRARPMDQVEIKHFAAELFDARVKCAQRFVETVIRIAEFRRHEDVAPP